MSTFDFDGCGSTEFNNKSMLSPREILAISDEINRKYAPLFVKIPASTPLKLALTASELLGISEEISRLHLPKLKNNRPALIVQPVDPAHFFVYWNSRALSDRKNVNPARRQVLRIAPETTGEGLAEMQKSEGATLDTGFDVTIETGQERQKIKIPEGFGHSQYRLSLGTLDDLNRFIPYNTPEKITPASADSAESAIAICLPAGGELPFTATSSCSSRGIG